MPIGEQIKRYRKEKRVTQRELSQKTGIAEITIRQYEAGKYEPKHDQLKKIAAALGVSLADLAPERYPLGFDINDEAAFEEYRASVVDKLEQYERQQDLDRIRDNQDRLNNAGIRKLADYSEDLVDSGKYEK